MNFKTFSYHDAENVLKNKKLLKEIEEINVSLKPEEAQHNSIQRQFQQRGWQLEKYIFNEVTWTWDAYKDKVAVSIEFSLIDAIQRDLLRAILSNMQGELDVLVFELDLGISQPHFENVKQQLEIFSSILKFPIYLMGIDRRQT